MSPHDWHLHMTRRLGSPLNFAEFSEAWNRTLDPVPIHGNDLFEGIAKKHKLALLSNTDSIHVAHIEANFDFVHYFPPAARIYSCAVRARKPSPVIFQSALRAVKAAASQAVFIDDILEFVDAARKLGLHGIHYQNPAQLRADLRTFDPSLPI